MACGHSWVYCKLCKAMHVQRNDTCPTVIPRICARVKQILIGWAHSDYSDQMVNWRFGNDNLLLCCSLSSCINSTIEFTNIVIYLTGLPMLMQYDRLQPISRHSQSVSLQFSQIIMPCYEKTLFKLSEKSPHSWFRPKHLSIKCSRFQYLGSVNEMQHQMYNETRTTIDVI